MSKTFRTRIRSIAARHEEGQNLLEFALLTFILLFIVLGIIGFSLIFGTHLALNLSVNTAARYAAVEDWGLLDCSGNYDLGIYNELVGSLIVLAPSRIQTITIYRANDDDGSMTTDKNVLNGAGARTLENYICSERTRGTTIGVQVVYRQPVIIPLISSITGEEMDVIKTATFRIQ